MYTYIYIEREREREDIYIYICRLCRLYRSCRSGRFESKSLVDFHKVGCNARGASIYDASPSEMPRRWRRYQSVIVPAALRSAARLLNSIVSISSMGLVHIDVDNRTIKQ